MSADNEQLRRSKRKKFHLDVSALNSSNPERRRTLPCRTVSPDGICRRTASTSPGPSVTSSVSPAPGGVVGEEEPKRPRRPTRNIHYIYDASDDEDDPKVGMSGSHMCTKCPCRFDTRPGLANHFKLHGGEKRKFGCESCDFSCGSVKAIRNHRRCHAMRIKVELDQCDADEGSSSMPSLQPVSAIEPNDGSPNCASPELDVISPPSISNESITPPINREKRNKCTECPFASRNRRRFENHMLNHKRTNGFRCHRCSLTTPSCGFLKRHILEIHKENESEFPWPPQFVKDGTETADSPNTVSQIRIPRKRGRGETFAAYGIREGESLRCPIADCTYSCYTAGQMASHKFRCHKIHTLLPFRCSKCGTMLRSRGAVIQHRLRKHCRKINTAVRNLLIKEAVGRHFLKTVYDDIVAKASLVAVEDAEEQETSNSSDIQAVPCASGSDSSSSSTASGSGPPSSPLLLGIELPEFLRGVAFDPSELSNELQKMHSQPFKCDDCPFGTSAKSKLDRHLDRHRVKSDLQCTFCTFSCRGDDIMSQHIRLHVAVLQKRRAEADKINIMLTPLIVNESSNHCSSPVPVIKSKPKPVRRKSQLTYTPVVMPDGTKMRRCLECPYVTKHSCDLSTHYQMHLSKTQRFKCTQCSYSTKRSVCLRQHYQSHREQNNKESAGKSINLRANGMNFGVRTGSGRWRIYSCNKCPFVNRTLVGLWHHSRNHILRKGARFRCSACEFYGFEAEKLDDHVLLHNSDNVSVEKLSYGSPCRTTSKTPTQKNAKLHCEDCPFGATTYQQLWAHRQKHKKSSKFTCPHCSYSISSEPLLREHVASHSKTVRHMSGTASYPILSELVKNEVEDEMDVKPVVSTASSSTSLRRNASYPDVGRAAVPQPKEESFEREPPKLNVPLKMDAILRIAMVNFDSPLPEKVEDSRPQSQCPDCPFHDSDPLLFRLHRELHEGKERPLRCDLCSFSCVTPETLHSHISLHMPNVNPEEAASERRRQVQRRRYQQMEIIPLGTPHFACSKCNFRCLTKDSFGEHMMGHAQDLQRRLATAIKRNAQQADDGRKSKLPRRNPRKTDRFYMCPECSFICETPSAFSRHSELHTLNGRYPCSICSYSANTEVITQFHERNHHTDHTVTSLSRMAVLAPDAVRLVIPDHSDKKYEELAGMNYSCVKCPEFRCLERLDLVTHYRENHSDTVEDRQVADRISHGLFPVTSIISSASS